MGQVVSELEGKVLDIGGDAMKEGAPVVMSSKRKDDTNQHWFLQISTGTVHNVANRDFVMDIENGKLVINHEVVGKKSQMFGIGPAYVYHLNSRFHVLTATGSTEGAAVVLSDFTGATNQKWKFTGFPQ